MQTELEGVAQQYAEALLDLAFTAGRGLDEAVALDLDAISDVIAKTPDLDIVLGHPAVSAQVKKNLLVASFGNQANELTVRLLELLSDKRRLELLPYIGRKYRQLLNARKNIMVASLVSSKPLNDQAIANIKARLTEHLGKKLELDVDVDKSLIGGLILKLGDQVIDGSLRGQLREIEKVLLVV